MPLRSTHHRPTPGTTPGRRLLAGTARVAEVLWPFVLVVLLWQSWISLGRVPAIVAPGPLTAVEALLAGFVAAVPDILATLLVIGLGLCAGMAAGIGLAALTWFSPLLSGLLTPVVVLVNAIPSIALIPIVASVVGFNFTTVVSVAALITFFPAFVLTASGLRAPPPGADDVMSVIGAGRFARFRHVALPAAVPHMVTALRIGSMLSVLGALTAEWLLGTSGMGYRLALAQQVMDTGTAWNFSLLGVVLSLVVFGIASSIERRVINHFR